MPTFTIPVLWQMSAKLQIEAPTLEGATEKAYSEEISLPQGDYMDGSFEVDKESPLYGEIITRPVVFVPHSSGTSRSPAVAEGHPMSEASEEEDKEVDDFLARDWLEGKALFDE